MVQHLKWRWHRRRSLKNDATGQNEGNVRQCANYAFASNAPAAPDKDTQENAMGDLGNKALFSTRNITNPTTTTTTTPFILLLIRGI